MNIQPTLDASVATHDLHNHPFYRAWSAGTLPVDALAAYARDWGAFVDVIDQGWETVGQAGYAEEERVHAQAWEQFAAALDTRIEEPTIPALAALRATAVRLFSQPATALGALYAFEAQQPGTSQSKLDGLRAHYSLAPAAERYFELHAGDDSEAKWLSAAIAALPQHEQQQAAEACEELCRALWDGLSGIYSEDCAAA